MSAILNQIHVKLSEPKENKENGIYLPESSIKKDIGKVISVGDGVKDDPMVVKVDDMVMFREGVGTEIDEKEKIHVIYQRDILAIL